MFHKPYRPFTWAVIVAAAVAGALAPVAPTGIAGVDVFWRALFAGVFTFAAGRARRNPRLLAGTVAAIGTVGAWPWGVVAFVGLGLVTGSARMRRPARPLGVIIGALQAQALLRLTWPDTSYATAAMAAVVFIVVVVSGFRHARSRERKPARILSLALGAVGLVVVGLVTLGLFSVQRDLRDGARAAKLGLDAARSGETAEAATQLERASSQLGSADEGLRGPLLRPGRLIPVLARYLDSGQHLTSAAGDVVSPALESARLAAGDALRIRDGRIDLTAVAELTPPLERTLAAVPAARAAVERLDDEELPGPIARRVRDLDQSLVNAVEDGEFVLDALDLVPQLLGADEPRRWFVLMQTPSEQRASGGIAGGFGELLVDDGQLELVRSGEANELNQVGSPWDLGPLAPEYARFPGTGPERYFQNVTNVPHFPTVGRTIVQVYPQAGGSPVDGVISVDPKVLGALLSLTGPIEVPGWGEPITAETVERTLLFDQYQRLDPTEGRQFVTDTIQATFDRLQSTTLPAPARVLHTLTPQVRAERIKLYSARPEEQALFEEMGVTGALPEVDGDFFQVVTQNVGQSKIDWFQQRTLSYDVRHDPITGRVEAVARITIANDAPSEGLSDLLIGGTNFPEPGPLGRSRLFVDFWSALDLDAATLDGAPIDLVTEQAYDRNLYWTVHTLEAGSRATFELYLSGFVEPGAPYQLDLGAQPVVRPDRVEVSVSGRRADVTSTGGLSTDSGVGRAAFEQRQPRRFVARSGT
jgi:Protein of unknown function (DUF4012)